MRITRRLIIPILVSSTLLIVTAALVGAASLRRTKVDQAQAAQPSLPGAFLTGPNEGEPLAIALEYLRDHLTDYGLAEQDLADVLVTDQYQSAHTGVTHIYLRQRVNGLEVFGANANINIARDGSVINLGSRFIGGLGEAANTAAPGLAAEEAVESAAQWLGLEMSEALEVREEQGGVEQGVVLSDGGISLEPIPARLVYQPVEKGRLRLAWEVSIYQRDAQAYWVTRVDAIDGEILDQEDLVIQEELASAGTVGPGEYTTGMQGAREGVSNSSPVSADMYRVYAMPVESPNHTTPAPPADGRTNEVNPASAASPFGWHDTDGSSGAESEYTMGNNVDAYEDRNDSNNPTGGDAARAFGGPTLVFSHSLDLTMAPSSYISAAVTNLFYWNNIVHDVLYEYGFDEVSGNFQENNYGNGGADSDSVRAEAQDGGGDCNANFFTPSDGNRPRMQMYECTNTSPARDGDLDNMVIIHEYGHGISNRLTGGPSNVGCLSNNEQMGEGWSDWYGLMLTMRAGDLPTDARGVGTYLFGQPANGPGIRSAPYSTDMAVNSYTYGDLPGQGIPHGVGFIWATMLWEMTWNLIDKYGFDADFYNGTGGNNLALQLVTDGLKLQPCSPGFVDGRDAILSADQSLTGGQNQCTIWRAFAKRGLGFSADQGSPSSRTDGTEAFDLPLSCQLLEPPPIPPVRTICQGDLADYTVNLGAAFVPPVTMSASGHPAGTTATFSPNPVPTVPNTTTLSISNTGSAAPGAYTIAITGTDSVLTSAMTTVDLNVFASSPGTASLVAPPNGATGVALAPIFDWSDVSGASDYLLEVDDDSGFGSIDYTATVSDSMHTPSTNLAGSTTYYWRVRADNPCGSGGYSPVFSFTTANVICSAPNLPIPDDDPAGVTDSMSVASTGAITDLDVSVTATHTWVGDLIFTVRHVDTGTSVTLIDRPGRTTTGFGCGEDDVGATLDDEGPDGLVENQCSTTPPALFGSPTPNNPLSAFDGENVNGTWEVTVSDNANGDTGTLVDWCLIPTTITGPQPQIAISPPVLSSTQASNSVVTQTLVISNTGTADLDWSVYESSSLHPGVIPAATSPAPAGSESEAREYLDTVYASSNSGSMPSGPVTLWQPSTAVLHDNGPLVNSPGTGAGGADESMVQNTSLGMTVRGFGNQASVGYRIADDFTISNAGGWQIDTITFFGYQTGAPTSGTMTAVNLRIWDGPPNGGGNVIWGDPSTNVMVSSSWSNIYRVMETTSGDTARAIMANVADLGGLILLPGTYWLDWQADGTLTNGPWAPPVTINGQATTGNALQWTGSWVPANDGGSGTQQGFPFIVEGSLGSCTPSDVPWLSLSPNSGTIAPAGNTAVDVVFDSTGLAVGAYTATLCVQSNDPVTSLVQVPVTLTVQSLAPSVAFTAMPLSGIAPLNVQFTDSTSGQVNNWSWDFGDGQSSTLQNPGHIYSQSGTFTVSLTASGPGGSDTLTRTNYITVYEPVSAAFSGNPLSGLEPLNVAFTNLSAGDFNTCSWSFGDSGTSSNCNNPSHTYNSGGVYTVTLTVSGPGGNDTETKASYITVKHTIYLPVVIKTP